MIHRKIYYVLAFLFLLMSTYAAAANHEIILKKDQAVTFKNKGDLSGTENFVKLLLICEPNKPLTKETFAQLSKDGSSFESLRFGDKCLHKGNVDGAFLDKAKDSTAELINHGPNKIKVIYNTEVSIK